MIKINRSGFLIFRKKKYKCVLGKSGITDKKIEGDFCTPKGNFRIIKIYYRSDKIKKFQTKIPLIKIKKNMGWCDDPRSNKYNRLIRLPFKYRYEPIYRRNGIYDIVGVLNYNYNYVKKNKGSAIFLHISKKNYEKTKGCIALKKKDLIKILSTMRSNEVIKVQ